MLGCFKRAGAWKLGVGRMVKLVFQLEKKIGNQMLVHEQREPICSTSKQKSKHCASTNLVHVFFQEIGRTPLLTHEQEIDYGCWVQKAIALNASKKELEKRLCREPSKGEWAESVGVDEFQLSEVLQQAQYARNRLIEANLKLVITVAKNYQEHNLEFLDLIQEGSLGLECAVRKFDPKRGYKFSTHAYLWIRQAITRAIAQQARTIRLPVHFIEKLSKIKKVQRQLSQQLKRIPTINELAAELQLTPKQVRDYLEAAREPMSLDLRVGKRNTSLGDLLKDENKTSEEYVLYRALQNDIRAALVRLTPQQRIVISLRFGLEDNNPLSLATIGSLMNLSRERIRQIERKALERLRANKSCLANWD